MIRCFALVRPAFTSTVLDVLLAVKAGVDVRIRGVGMPVVCVRQRVQGVRAMRSWGCLLAWLPGSVRRDLRFH